MRRCTAAEQYPDILSALLTLRTVVVENWSRLPTVRLDVSDWGWSKGQGYRLRNVADYAGDVLTATYDGHGTLPLPMTGHSVARPNGYSVPIGVDTFPAFGVFQVQPCKKPHWWSACA